MKAVLEERVQQHTVEQMNVVFGGNAEHIEKPIANGMLGNVEAFKIHGGVDAERAHADGARSDEPQEQQQHRSEQ